VVARGNSGAEAHHPEDGAVVDCGADFASRRVCAPIVVDRKAFSNPNRYSIFGTGQYPLWLKKRTLKRVCPMSALGQKQTSEQSALPSKADIETGPVITNIAKLPELVRQSRRDPPRLILAEQLGCG
jgi:hypothetical protein